MSEIHYYKKWGNSTLQQKTPLKRKTRLKPFGKKRKRRSRGTSQLDVFNRIWEQRPHVCENCGAGINEFNIRNFAHIYSKNRFTYLALDKRNIALVCQHCHHRDHNDPSFRWSEEILQRADRAKREHYNQD